MSRLWPLLIVLTLAPRLASACTVCFGGPNSPASQAVSMAIFLLLGVVGMVFLGAGGFVFYLARRARSPLPDARDFTADTSD